MTVAYSFRQEILAIQPYVPGKSLEEVKRELGLTDVVKMASNENPLGPSQLVQAAIRQAIPRIHQYPDGSCFELKKKIASRLQVAEDQIILGNGSDEVIKYLGEALLKPGDEVLTAAPSYLEYNYISQLMGAALIRVPLREHRYDLMAMAGRITPRTKLIFICNPNNPTGTYVSRLETDAFLDRVPETAVVVFDEAYFEFVQGADFPGSLDYIRQGKPNVVVLRTFSKIYALAGLRIGYGIACAELIGLLNRTREPFNVNLLAQAAALAALEDRQHLRASQAVTWEGRDYIVRMMGEMGLTTIPSQSNCLMIDTGRPAREVFQGLLQLGVIVRSGEVFGMDTYIRITVGTREQNERLVRSLRQVLAKG